MLTYAGRLWFSDWIAGEIIAIDDAGAFELMVAHESLPLCFDFLPCGRPALVSNRQMALLTLQDDGSLATYAHLSALSRFGCNDIAVDGRGNAHANSPDFEFSAGPPDGPVQPGFVALVTPDATARVVVEDIAFPNGMAVTSDNRTLVVADSYPVPAGQLRDRPGRQPVRPPGVGRPRRRGTGRHLPRR